MFAKATPAATAPSSAAGTSEGPVVSGAATPGGAQGAPAGPVAVQQGAPAWAPQQATGTNVMAIFAFVVAIASIFLGWVPLPVPGILPLVAVGLGVGANAQMDRTGEQGRGLATAAIVIGAVVAVVILFVWSMFWGFDLWF